MIVPNADASAAGAVLCNGCLTLVDAEWEPLVRLGEFAFHRRCAPVCTVCGSPLATVRAGTAADFYVLDAAVEFVSARGYQVQLKVCCCDACYTQALHDDPSGMG